MTEVFSFRPGTTPVLISIPHAGRAVPEEIADRLTDAARPLPDTDWHVDRLYDFAAELGVGLLVATQSRYVIDLNRDPGGMPLYPEASNTELCPLRTFDNQAVYAPGGEPDKDEVAYRLEHYWKPYHHHLRRTLAGLRDTHGKAVLIDGHSIRSQVPRFFEGRLPDLNFGTARGVSADRVLAADMHSVLEAARGYRAVRDARFTGGYITRHYGQPADGIHAVQLELAQLTYMEERPPYRYKPDLAARLKPVLRQMVEIALAWARR